MLRTNKGLKQKIAFSVFLCFFGLSVFILSGNIPVMHAIEKSSIINSRFYPKLIGAIIFIFSAIMAVNAYLKLRQYKKETAMSQGKNDLENGFSFNRLLIIIASYLIYVISFIVFGFVISTFFFVIGISFLLGERRKKILLLSAVLISFGVFFVFKILLEVPLPHGLLL
jgi:putative tricarboxylic transport membrane protein